MIPAVKHLVGRLRIGKAHRRVLTMKTELTCAVDDADQGFRVIIARHLHNDAVDALRRDENFLVAGGIDTAAHDFD